ncbi:hypothetical protein LOAG_15302 [Loa loa]|uniref:Uncharacterized protein n=1 Tax=Loa loa TaxID=7209 RepID=A0A1S0TG58_LOALO|nr:hypothetical protein LOAG_15302 [Loa loa]EFO13229.2 hypothetical protein LOAG_15302 [Loa loa]
MECCIPSAAKPMMANMVVMCCAKFCIDKMSLKGVLLANISRLFVVRNTHCDIVFAPYHCAGQCYAMEFFSLLLSFSY